MRVKKILFVFGSLERAGAQWLTLEVCRELGLRYPIHFDFCALGLGPIQLHAEVEDIEGTIHCVPVRSPRFIIEFSDLLRKGQYDVVSSFSKLATEVVTWLAARHDVPMRIAN